MMHVQPPMPYLDGLVGLATLAISGKGFLGGFACGSIRYRCFSLVKRQLPCGICSLF